MSVPDEVTFRWLERLTTSDRDSIADLFSTVVDATTILGYSTRLTDVQMNTFLNKMTNEITAGSCHLLLAGSGQSITGMVLLRRDEQPNCTHIGELCKGMVHPRWRGRGIVAGALSEIAKKARELDIDLLKLDVREGAVADIWRSYGFTEYGRLQDYARENGKAYAGVYLIQPIADLEARLHSDGVSQ